MLSKNPNVQQYGIGKPVHYYHIECPNYFTDNIIAEGLVVESFRNGQISHRQVYTWNEHSKGFIRKPEPPNILPALGKDCINMEVGSNPVITYVTQHIKDTRIIHIPK
jgi:hypothetical protein